MRAWHNWYHVTGNTYGTWLRGDARGWRARRHREHVIGDYKNPPSKGAYELLRRLSQERLKRPPVFLNPSQRDTAGKVMVERLTDLGVEVLAISLDPAHYHILGRFPQGSIRLLIGRAKKHASHLLRQCQLPGRVWAKGCRALPIRGRSHQLNAFRYIVSHASKGAWAWTFRKGLYWKDGA